jgi:hypothetical protein
LFYRQAGHFNVWGRSRKTRFQKNSRLLRNSGMSFLHGTRAETVVLPAIRGASYDPAAAFALRKSIVEQINMEAGIKQLQFRSYVIPARAHTAANLVRWRDI